MPAQNATRPNLERAAFAVPVVVSVTAVVYIVASGQGSRVSGQWPSALTMVFGSFLAGSSPEGGGAVAFPIFTKVLEIDAPVARSFGLFIQAAGMTSASAFILAKRRPIDARAAVLGACGGIIGLLFAIVVLTDPDHVFRAPVLPSAWVKVLFTLILAMMSWLMISALRRPDEVETPMVWSRRAQGGVCAAAVMGGVLSAFTGTGVNVLLFLFIVTLCGTRTSIAVPTSILAMTAVSIVGFVVLGLIDGQLSIGLDTLGNVASVGGVAVDGLDAARYDLFALWLAAVPVVVWGAPIGAAVIARVRENHLVAFVGLLAAVEVVSTLVLVAEIRQSPALLAVTVVGLGSIPTLVSWLERSRHRLLGLEPEPVT